MSILASFLFKCEARCGLLTALDPSVTWMRCPKCGSDDVFNLCRVCNEGTIEGTIGDDPENNSAPCTNENCPSNEVHDNDEGYGVFR